MKQPLVSCIMPTANRPQFLPYAIDYFLHQDYRNIELIILDDGIESVQSLVPNDPRIKYHYSENQQLLGSKRNFCCEQARGDLIVHLDDDDWYAEDWVTKQVNALISSGADVTGLKDVNLFINISNQKWEYRDENHTKPWVYGATLAYWKSFWTNHRFKEMNTGEDNDFIWSSNAVIHPHDYTAGYLGMVHGTNIGVRPFENLREKVQVSKWLKILKQAETAKAPAFDAINSANLMVSCIMPTANRPNFVSLSIDNFLQQNYSNKELIIIDDGTELVDYLVPEDSRIHYFYVEPKQTIGSKRNMACEKANGELIVHWDDDDWYALDWISYQVHVLEQSGADICGINQVQYYSAFLKQYWMTKKSNSHYPWLSGQSLIYRKSFWEEHPFKDLQVGGDDDFVYYTGAKIFAHEYYQGIIARLHPHNVSRKFFEDPRTKISVTEES